MGMGLQEGSARPEHFAPLASEIARSADFTQAALHRRQISRLGHGGLSGGLSCAIHIEDEPMASFAIPQPAWLFRTFQRASHHIFQKERTQSLDCGLVERREIARERRAVRQAFPSEQGHEGVSERLNALIERCQSHFAADGIPQQNCHKVDEIIMPETPTRHPRTCSSIATSTPWRFKKCAITLTSPNQQGIEGMD